MKAKRKYYVTMTDRFMSGWGMARGMTNKLVLTCDTLDEAERVYDKAINRNEMKYVNIRMTKPYYNESYNFVSWHDKTDYSNWYK